ncbi:hypothetical protein FVO59_10590 [Microbacterium esteraromaticum]|uniref:Uncharacterized protein n=1 Tax=Microbacterium esteraromaticum TaxID=57043 RepID=A0A7D7WBI9_9MICO|nr:DUF6264 family protein [Microbacterium esteraromaticum]QMU97615.1 hypothetical protein FVO59_10590 [Microbacterium esteraromaticum]
MSADRPQYGEYASPEEQRARAGLPPLNAEPAASVPQLTPAAPVSPAVAAGSTAPARPVGRLITFVLLGFGLVNVLSSIPQFVNMSSTLNESMQLLGLEGEFTNFAAARTWGVIAVVVLLAGYATTAWLSFRQLKRNRAAWWIPLVGFVVTMSLVSACISIVMFSDPAFTAGLLSPPAG